MQAKVSLCEKVKGKLLFQISNIIYIYIYIYYTFVIYLYTYIDIHYILYIISLVYLTKRNLHLKDADQDLKIDM